MTASEDVALITILPLTILFWAWVVWVILEWRKTRHKSQLQNKIVDKFSSVQEFNDFLQSKEGNKFLNFIKFNGLAPKEKPEGNLGEILHESLPFLLVLHLQDMRR